MEPQIATTDSANQKKAKPPKESVRSILTSPRYWLAALLPILLDVIWSFIFFRLNSNQTEGLDATHAISTGFFLIAVLLVENLLLGTVASFVINFFLPFATNFRRAIFLSLPTLILTILYTVLASLGDSYVINTLITNGAS